MILNLAGLLYAAQKAAVARMESVEYTPELDISGPTATGYLIITISDTNGYKVDDDTMLKWLRVVLEHLDGPVSSDDVERVFGEGRVCDEYAEFRVKFER